jgi:hypothetical protein
MRPTLAAGTGQVEGKQSQESKQHHVPRLAIQSTVNAAAIDVVPA